MDRNKLAKKHQDDGNWQADELSKLLITSSSAMLIFWAAVGVFILKDSQHLIHPKYIWILFFLSLIFGIVHLRAKIQRSYDCANALMNDKQSKNHRLDVVNGETVFFSRPSWIEKTSRTLQPATFLAALIVSAFELF